MLSTDYIGYWLGITSTALARKASSYLAGFGLTIRQFGLLAELYQEDGLTSRQLADNLGSDSSTIMALVDQLEKKELIRRKPGQKDRRIKHLVLTEKAHSMKEQLFNSVDQFDGHLMQHLTTDEMKLMKSTLQKILKFAQEV